MKKENPFVSISFHPNETLYKIWEAVFDINGEKRPFCCCLTSKERFFIAIPGGCLEIPEAKVLIKNYCPEKLN